MSTAGLGLGNSLHVREEHAGSSERVWRGSCVVLRARVIAQGGPKRGDTETSGHPSGLPASLHLCDYVL